MSYEISIGDVDFADLGSGTDRFALNCWPEAPRYATEFIEAPYVEGLVPKDFGYRGNLLFIHVAYVSTDPFALVMTDMATWGANDTTLDINGTEYEFCRLQENLQIERFSGVWLVTYQFLKYKDNEA